MTKEVSWALNAAKAKYLFLADEMSQLRKDYGKRQSVSQLPDWIQQAYREVYANVI